MDIEFLVTELPQRTVTRHDGGTVSGHAAGEPFDKCVEKVLKEHYPDTAMRQFEYLNALYHNNLAAETAEARHALIRSPAARLLLSRGNQATKDWRPDNLFEEKQNDTADALIVDTADITAATKFTILDVKTKNRTKKAQPPNIISAYKLADTCALILGGDTDSIDIYYVGVEWDFHGDTQLICTEACVKNLFLIPPRDLYINWAAAMQIQFDVSSVDQSFAGTQEDWARAYLKIFTASAAKRSDEMRKKFVLPYLGYVT